MKKFFQLKSRGFTRLVDFGEAILSCTKSGSPKFTTGFTLVEVLVAISIFTVSILALMSVLTQGIIQTNYAKTKIIATYLAQEGIEYMRNMRDTFVLYTDPLTGQTGWDAFNNKVAPPGNTICDQLNLNGCFVGDLAAADYSNPSKPMTTIAVTACGGTCPTLLYDGTTGKYSYVPGGINSGYIRKIRVLKISANETKVFSTVYWKQSSGSYSVVFSESLFNWVQ
jgi:prepilin-type N-terminal cleavage/methylation domain-containing protein